MNLETPRQSYSTLLRQENPEKMAEVEEMVRSFFDKVKLPGESLDDKSVALVANGVVNRMQRKALQGATEAELNKAIEDALYEGVDTRLKLKERGLENARFVLKTESLSEDWEDEEPREKQPE